MRACLLLALAACSVDAVDAAPATVPVITNLAPGRFAIENPTSTTLKLKGTATLERKTSTGWVAIPDDQLDLGTGYKLTASCGAVAACVDLAPGATLRPAPFTGMSCSSQCNLRCRANAFLAGTYRLVLTSCDGATRTEGPAFDMTMNASGWERLGITTGVTSATTMRADLPKGYDPHAPSDATHVAGLGIRPGTERPLATSEIDALLALLRDPKSFDDSEVKRCKSNDHHIAFKLARSLATTGAPRSEPVELTVDFACHRIFAAHGGTVDAAFFDGANAAWVAFAKALFPKDAEIAALR